jgi:hypothetical protein
MPRRRRAPSPRGRLSPAPAFKEPRYRGNGRRAKQRPSNPRVRDVHLLPQVRLTIDSKKIVNLEISLVPPDTLILSNVGNQGSRVVVIGRQPRKAAVDRGRSCDEHQHLRAPD